jgi:hypothetical protein
MKTRVLLCAGVHFSTQRVRAGAKRFAATD